MLNPGQRAQDEAERVGHPRVPGRRTTHLMKSKAKGKGQKAKVQIQKPEVQSPRLHSRSKAQGKSKAKGGTADQTL